jgi:ADP-ribose diphosphatase
MTRSTFAGYEVLSDDRIGAGGFLIIRRLRLRVRRSDGTLSKEGVYDVLERPMGADAVVLALWHRRADGTVDVLLRNAPRVPLYFRDPAMGTSHTEVVAGVVEVGEEGWAAIQRRAAAEAHEEAGVRIDPAAVERLGPHSFPTSGLLAEIFHFAAAEVRDRDAAETPPTDGSPFEEGAELSWVPLDEALRRCDTGEIVDLKTELALRRLRAKL